jgi:signal transduction histidine kinase
MLVNLAGEYLQAPNVSHEWGWMLNHKHSFRKHFPEAWQQIQGQLSGQFRVNHDLYTFQRLSPAETAEEPSTVAPVEGEDVSSLLLFSYIPESVVTTYSNKLLRQLLLMYAGALALASVLSLYWARSGAIRQCQERQLADSEARLRRLSSCLLTAQETERRNLSRTLHDELGQLVTSISLDLKSAAREPVGEHVQGLLRRATDETDQLLRSLHVIASRVRPSVLDDLGLSEAMESYISEYERRTGISVRCDVRMGHADLPATVKENVYRIFQEALANVATHAQTKEVLVSVEVEEDQVLHMLVQDRGRGFQPDELGDTSRLGILGMRERVELLNGEFRLTSKPGEGTAIRVAIPLQAADSDGRVYAGR